MRKATTEDLEKGKIFVSFINEKEECVIEKSKITMPDGFEIQGDCVEIKLCEEKTWLLIIVHRNGSSLSLPQKIVEKIR